MNRTSHGQETWRLCFRFKMLDRWEVTQSLSFSFSVECIPWTLQCKAVFYGKWWKKRSLVVKDKRQITMDSGGPSGKIPSDQDSYTGQARCCSVGDPIQGVLQHRWKNIYTPEQGGQMQKEITLNYYLIFPVLHYNLIYMCVYPRQDKTRQDITFFCT